MERLSGVRLSFDELEDIVKQCGITVSEDHVFFDNNDFDYDLVWSEDSDIYVLNLDFCLFIQRYPEILDHIKHRCSFNCEIKNINYMVLLDGYFLFYETI